MNNIESITSIVESTITKYYKMNSPLRLGTVKEEENKTYLIDIKFEEDFITELGSETFNKLRGTLHRELNKLFPQCSTGSCGSCHGCGSTSSIPYKIQFSEEN